MNIKAVRLINKPYLCIECALCDDKCPFNAIITDDARRIDLDICKGCNIGCDTCVIDEICPIADIKTIRIEYDADKLKEIDKQ